MHDWITRAMFMAPWWSLPINPWFLPRRALWQAMADVAPHTTGRLVDVGCGTKPYHSLFTHVSEYLGLELDTPTNRQTKLADLFYDGKVFPMADNSVDVLLCNQVLEHVFEPEHFLAETWRVLCPGGTLILTVPFLWPEHEQPQDCLRYTSFGLHDWLLKTGLIPIRQDKLTHGWGALCALAASRVNTTLRPAPMPLRLFGRLLLIAPISLLGWTLASSSKEADLYLDNFVVCRKPQDST